MSEVGSKDSSLVPVVILGQTYNVRADENVEYIEELARYVDTKMRSISESTGTVDPVKVAILAALNLADEFFKLEEKHRDETARVATTTDELVSILAESLREPTETAPG